MAVQEHRSDPGLAREFRRLRARPAVLVTALVFAGLAGFGGLGVVPALMGFAAIALAVLASAPSPPDRQGVIIAPTDERGAAPSAPAVADRLVEAVISALPQPAIALTTESLVVTFNAGVQSIAPGIFRGEPLSFAFRFPTCSKRSARLRRTGKSGRSSSCSACRSTDGGRLLSRRCRCRERHRTRIAT